MVSIQLPAPGGMHSPGVVTASTGSPLNQDLQNLKLWRRLHIRLTVLYGSATLFALTLLAINIYQNNIDSEVKALQRRILATAVSLAKSINGDTITALPAQPALWRGMQIDLIRRFRETAQADQEIRSIYLLRPGRQPNKLAFIADYESHGTAGKAGELYDAADIPVMMQGFAKPTVEKEPVRDRFGLTLSGYAPVQASSGQSAAVLGVDVDARRIEQIRLRVLQSTLLVFVIAILLMALIALLVARVLQAPLSRLISATGAVARGDLTTRVELNRSDELGLMSSHFDIMVNQLQDREFIRETFGRYLSQQVANEVLSQRSGITLDGEERVVSVLFSDLCAYSSISEQMSPQQIVSLLNDYLGSMNEIVDRHGGCILEYVGDAVFAVFGAPYYRIDHAEQAARCAICMHESLVRLNQEWQRSGKAEAWQRNGIESIRMRIGIHAGQVIAGNLGSRSRMKYSVIGDTVNVASRLEGLNRDYGTDIIISRDVWQSLPIELAELFSDQGHVSVKGREQTVRIYAHQSGT